MVRNEYSANFKTKEINIIDLKRRIEQQIMENPEVIGKNKVQVCKDLLDVLDKALSESIKMDDSFIS